MKHRQNKERILLPVTNFETPEVPETLQASMTWAGSETPSMPATNGEALQPPTTTSVALEAFQLSATQTIELQIDTELRDEIRRKSNDDETILEIREKLTTGVTRDGKIVLGLCEEKHGLLTYDGLVRLRDQDELRVRILRDHHDALAAGHPGRA
jgi:hypothetical protein